MKDRMRASGRLFPSGGRKNEPQHAERLLMRSPMVNHTLHLNLNTAIGDRSDELSRETDALIGSDQNSRAPRRTRLSL